MSSHEARFSPGSKLRQFLLIEKLGEDHLGSEWSAQDTILGRLVALRIFSPAVTADRERLDLIASEVRLAAHLDVPAIGKVYEFDHADDVHFIVSEFVEGQSLASELRTAVDTTPLLHIAIAVAGALDHACSHDVIHGNLHARHVLVAEDGRVKVLGFGAGRGSVGHGELHSVAGPVDDAGYLSPEGIVGRPLDFRSDVFSIGVLLYEMGTGSRPFTGGTSQEICERILHAAPAAPHLINPAIEPAIVAVIGKCIQKDPSRRYPSGGALLADLRNVEKNLRATTDDAKLPAHQVPESPADTGVAGASSEQGIETTVTRTGRESDPTAGSARSSVILYAAVADPSEVHDEKSKALAGRLQQILDETIYLADGKILDPFANHVVAEFEDSFNAIRAARKGLHDLESYNGLQAGRAPTVDARFVVLRGDIETVGGSLRGPALEIARAVARTLEPAKLAVSAELLSETTTPNEGVALITVAGRTFYGVPSASFLVPPAVRVSEFPEPPRESAPTPRSSASRRFIAVGVALLLVTGLAAAALMVKRNAAADRQAKLQVTEPTEPTVVQPRAPTPIALEAISVEGTIDPALVQLAGLARFGALGLIDSVPDFAVAPTRYGGEELFSATLRSGPAGVELVPVRLTPTRREGEGIPLTGQTAITFGNWILQEMGSPVRFEPSNTNALDHFSKAVAAASGQMALPPSSALTSIREAIRADPGFRPAQLLASEVFERSGDRKAAIEAARRASELDPEDLAVRRRLAKWVYQSGDPAGAIAAFSQVLARERTDRDALTAAGLYALALRDEAVFMRVLSRMEGSPGPSVLHQPDLLLAATRFDQAAAPYFDLEREDPENAALALKIGRIAVLRHMNSIAEIELQKLERLDPAYGLPMLRAYIHAQNGRREEAEGELKKAQIGAPWYAQPYTNAAEVYAVLGVQSRVIESLELAVARGEPTGAYVLDNPLFRYLRGEARFVRLAARIVVQQAAIRQALSEMPL